MYKDTPVKQHGTSFNNFKPNERSKDIFVSLLNSKKTSVELAKEYQISTIRVYHIFRKFSRLLAIEYWSLIDKDYTNQDLSNLTVTLVKKNVDEWNTMLDTIVK